METPRTVLYIIDDVSSTSEIGLCVKRSSSSLDDQPEGYVPLGSLSSGTQIKMLIPSDIYDVTLFSSTGRKEYSTISIGGPYMILRFVGKWDDPEKICLKTDPEKICLKIFRLAEIEYVNAKL